MAAALVIGACSKAPEPAATQTPAATQSAPATAKHVAAPAEKGSAGAAEQGSAATEGVAWRKGDVDEAFAAAKAEGKPLFLYWGAVWCPPCNQVKATIFSRQDFIDRSRFFVPVYLDGDSKSAQRLGARFRISGYPTMILFNPDGTEVTRLPGEVDADQYMRVLAMGMNGARPVKSTLAAALAPAKTGAAAKLSPEDWRMLAYYSWETSEEQWVSAKELPATLARLASACPSDQEATATRLHLKAIAAASAAKDAKPVDDKAARERVVKVLADPAIAREHFDLVTDEPSKVIGHVTLPGSSERKALAAAWDRALVALIGDARLSATDRLVAVGARVDIAKLDAPKGTALPDALLASVREQAARGNKETADPYAREVVVNEAADVLAEAGLFDESDALLEAELARSQTPYYHMLGLAANAKKRGDKAAAVAWSEKAYGAASGPATRLQWGSSYVGTLIDLTPDDAPRIERAALQVIGELEPVPDTFYDRNRRALERMAKKLVAWNKGNAHAGSLRRIRVELTGVCAKLPGGDPARAACDSVWNPPKAARA
ncbi:MAG TPA: thioredoxin family protein [Casimicrobiaceae bacterium]|nr:thioredoxin family protein [Casimicrobiaceae bacterium]